MMGDSATAALYADALAGYGYNLAAEVLQETFLQQRMRQEVRGLPLMGLSGTCRIKAMMMMILSK